jgi:K+-transporting ATPase KdpF subunit
MSSAANACGPRNKVTAMLGNILLIVVSVLLFGYLFYALLKPEKF